MDNIDQLIKYIKQSKNIVFFGGAGVSVESGIPDFRSDNGLYNDKDTMKEFGHNANIPVETILSHSFFMRYPEEFYKFYRNKMVYLKAKPNACHLGLAKLEEMGKLKAVITQNIDGLHSLAGSKNVLELHGSIYRNHCMKCGKSYDIKYIMSSKDCPHCSECRRVIKPDVVLYEESLDNEVLYKAILAIQKADVLIVGGTSLSVYPAAGLLQYYTGKKLVIINKSITQYDQVANLVINKNIGEVFKEVMEELEENGN